MRKDKITQKGYTGMRVRNSLMVKHWETLILAGQGWGGWKKKNLQKLRKNHKKRKKKLEICT